MARRPQLIRELLEAGRENSTATVLFHAALAERVGLGSMDHKALDLLLREGAMTAGQLGRKTGLASASVTALIDRLEQRGFARRRRDPADRRRIAVEAVPQRLAVIAAEFEPFLRGLDRLLKRYDDHQLETIRDFLLASARLLREEVETPRP
jgi:DNA-binding MarR family transcriptional regulator